MKIDKVFVSINAKNFAAQSEWWAKLLDRHWDREPMPSCHEWDIAGCMLFQVLDNGGEGGPTSATFHLADLDSEIDRLRAAGIDAPDPVKIDGFDTLRFAQFEDPEGNPVGLLDGS